MAGTNGGQEENLALKPLSSLFRSNFSLLDQNPKFLGKRMAFKQVFYTLQEVFPQIDLRILKAVAGQYSSDVDAAVEFVLSDVLLAVSEPTETYNTLHDVGYAEHGPSESEKPEIHDQNISLADQRAIEDNNLFLEPSTGSNNTFGDSNAFANHVGPSYMKGTMDECGHIEDKVVINESKTLPTEECAEAGSSSTPEIEPLLMEYETSASKRFGNYCATENEKMHNTLPKTKNIDHHCNTEDNSELSDLFASAGSVSPLFIQNPSHSAMKYEGQVPIKLPKAENTRYLSKSEDNYNLSALFVNFFTTENGGQTSKNLPNAQNIHDLSKSGDNYNLPASFDNFCTSDSAGQVSDVLPNAENNSDLYKSEDNDNLTDLFGNVCTADSTAQAPRLLRKVENAHHVHHSDDNCILSDLFTSSGSIKNSSHICEKYENCQSTDNEEQALIDFTKPGTVSSLCNSGDNFNLSGLFGAAQSISLSGLDSKCEARDGIKGEILGTKIEEKQSGCPTVEHGTFVANGMKMMPAEDNDEYLDISTQSDQIAQINEFISDFSKSKETLASSYESTIAKMKHVEIHEENARQVKEAAATAHQDFLTMVESFNHLAESSKELNDEQAQKIREEKSSLASLAQALQSRLTNMSAQRDEALTVIEEIKCTLDAQLASSMEEEAAAKQEIAQREKLTQLVRKEKEAIMENIMEESRKLQKEAEENILLREFLLDRGRIIDILQGEISSIHTDVMALKERTNRNKLKSAPVASSSLAASACTADTKGISAGGDPSSRNENQRELPQEQILANNAGYHMTTSDDDEWEVLNTTQS